MANVKKHGVFCEGLKIQLLSLKEVILNLTSYIKSVAGDSASCNAIQRYTCILTYSKI